MSNFKNFQNEVKKSGGIWKDESNVYFSQHRDFYIATYQPNFPETSEHDKTIILNHTKLKR